MEKNIIDVILETYPELGNDDFHPVSGSIVLQDDSDDNGPFIAKWEYSKPIPDGLKLGK